MSTSLGTYCYLKDFMSALKDLAIDEYISWVVPQEMEILEAEDNIRKSLSSTEFVVSSSFAKGTVKVEKIN